jgi:hypothetical protein
MNRKSGGRRGEVGEALNGEGGRWRGREGIGAAEDCGGRKGCEVTRRRGERCRDYTADSRVKRREDCWPVPCSAHVERVASSTTGHPLPAHHHHDQSNRVGRVRVREEAEVGASTEKRSELGIVSEIEEAVTAAIESGSGENGARVVHAGFEQSAGWVEGLWRRGKDCVSPSRLVGEKEGGDALDDV